jgi:4'-phosphopantetheinyl transferase
VKAETVIIHVLSAASADSFLSADEILRAANFKFPEHAARWKSFRSGLRRILGEALGVEPADVPLVTGLFGKPGLAPPYAQLHFNLSHCDDFALVAVCEDGPVGIDMEPFARARSLLDCAESYCHPAEISALPVDEDQRAVDLLGIWCAKEALLKALGTGFSQAPEQVRLTAADGFVMISPDTPLEEAEAFRTYRIRPPGLDAFCATVAVPASVINFIGAEIRTSNL